LAFMGVGDASAP